MTDFSIKNNTGNNEISKPISPEDIYKRSKKLYEMFVERTAKSEFANSPILKQRKLEFLGRLRDLADQYGFDGELEWIEHEVNSLTEEPKTDDVKPKTIPYYRPIHKPQEKHNEVTEGLDTEQSVENLCEDSEEVDAEQSVENLGEDSEGVDAEQSVENLCEDSEGVDAEQSVENLGEDSEGVDAEQTVENLGEDSEEVDAEQTVENLGEDSEEINAEQSVENLGEDSEEDDVVQAVEDSSYDSDEFDLGRVIEACKDNNGECSENVLELISAFQPEGKKAEYYVPLIVQKCRDINGNISGEKVAVLSLLAQKNMSAAFLSGNLGSLIAKGVDGAEVINFDLCENIAKVKSFGYEDGFALDLAKFITLGNFDIDKTINYANNLLNAQISPHAVLHILNSAVGTDKITGEQYINERTIKSIITLKSVLVKNRMNELKEQQSPINIANRPVKIADTPAGSIYKRQDGGMQFIQTPSEKSISKTKEDYIEKIALCEDNVLYKLLDKYKTTEGALDIKYIRILMALTSFGVVLNSLDEIMKLCLDKSGSIDVNTIKVIGQYKKNGALSKDIPSLLSLPERNENGEYNQNMVNTVSVLSHAAIGLPYMTKLASDACNNEKLKDFLSEASVYFETKNNLVEIVDMVKSDGENVDETALEIVDDILFSENNDMNETDFMEYIGDILQTARGDNQYASKGAEKICCLIDTFNPQDIKILLETAKNRFGIVDDKLSELAWVLYQKGYDLDSIINTVNSCKYDGYIDYTKADLLSKTE